MGNSPANSPYLAQQAAQADWAQADPALWAQAQVAAQVQAAQAQQGSQLQQGLGGWGAMGGFAVIPEPPSHTIPLVELPGLHTKAHIRIMDMIERLPMTIAAHIVSVAFYKADAKAGTPHRFVVAFDNQHTLELTEINTFPSDKDLAQVALECP